MTYNLGDTVYYPPLAANGTITRIYDAHEGIDMT